MSPAHTGAYQHWLAVILQSDMPLVGVASPICTPAHIQAALQRRRQVVLYSATL